MSVAVLKNPNAAERAFAEAFAALDAPTPAQTLAWERFARAGLPHRRVEGWRWSDVRAALGAAVPEVRDGTLVANASRPPDVTAPLTAAPSEGLPALAAAMTGVSDVFELTENEPPLTIAWEAGPGFGARVVAVIVPAGVSARVTETIQAEPGGVANIAVRYVLERGARLERVVAAFEARDATIVSVAGVELADEARFTQTTLALGGRLMRLETHADVQGEGAAAVLNGVSLLSGSAHADHTTHVTHAAPGSVTRETFRTVVADAASGVFQGKIKVERGAQKTDARMSHAALLLSEDAAANAKPELEIYADDVQCAHGNTAGALDGDALFYLRQRGLPEAAAKALLTKAFVAEALEEVEDADARAALAAEVERWMEQRL